MPLSCSFAVLTLQKSLYAPLKTSPLTHTGTEAFSSLYLCAIDLLCLDVIHSSSAWMDGVPTNTFPPLGPRSLR